MSRLSRLLAGATLGIAGLIVGVAISGLATALGLGLAALATAATSRRFAVGRTIETGLALGALVVATVIATLVTPAGVNWYSGRLTLLFCAVSLTAFIVALTRLLVARPFGGYPTTSGLTLFAVLGASTAQLGQSFPVLLGLYLLLQLWAMNRCDEARPDWASMTGRHRRLVAVGLVLAGTATIASAGLLPPAYDWSVRRFRFEILGARSGFSTRLNLDGLGGMLQSDEVVLRIYGAETDHLRGVLYNRYSKGRWLSTNVRGLRVISTPPVAGDLDDDWVEIRSIGGTLLRYFVPLEASDLEVEGQLGRVDAMGVVYPSAANEAERLRFVMGQSPTLAPSDPVDRDREVPESISIPLSEVANRWAPPSAPPRAQIEAMVDRLHRDFNYSLSFERRRGVDPIIDFFDRKTGHCEYFASALALLARTRDIPTRVVAGYRVTEYNSVGGYRLVRERNAHAWVEAWLPGEGWQTFDPTPPSALEDSMLSRTPWPTAIADSFAAILGQASRWLQARTLLELGAALVSLLLLWLMIRVLRRRRSRIGEDSSSSALEYSDPRPTLVRLLTALESSGEARSAQEPLERFARRISSSEKLHVDLRGTAAELITRYAAWRYGGLGAAKKLDRDIERWLVRLEGR